MNQSIKNILQHSCERRCINKSKNSPLQKIKYSTPNSCQMVPPFPYCGRKGEKCTLKAVMIRLAAREGDYKTLSEMTRVELNPRDC